MFGVDLRGANVENANLSEAVVLNPVQGIERT
jgi:uncharacterized protein YjbI with pentapeptide repeats